MAIRAVTNSATTTFDHARDGMNRGERKLHKAAADVAKGDFGPNPIVEFANAEVMYGANA